MEMLNLEAIRNRKVKTILQFAIPSIIAMVLTSMINIVDGFFVGNYVGAKGLAAINLGLPIVYLYLAIGLMIAVGGISIAGRMAGAGERERANQVFRQTMAFCILVTALLTVLFLLGLGKISDIVVSDEITKTYFFDYYVILIFELPMMVLTSALGMFIRGEGNPIFVMWTNILSVVCNIVLDYIFIGPLKLGVKGVAFASLLSAGIVLSITILYFVFNARLFRFGRFFEKNVLKEMIFNGSSEFIGELSMCISMAAYNSVIMKHAGVDGVAAFTIIGYVSYLFSMIIIGFGQGIVPIVSFAYGANDFVLSKEIRNATFKLIVGIASAVFVIMSLCAPQYSNLFSSNREVNNMVIPGLRLQMLSFSFAGVNSIASFYFTAIGCARESAIISASRGLVVLMVCIIVLPLLFGITGVWSVSVVTELVTLVFTIAFIERQVF